MIHADGASNPGRDGTRLPGTKRLQMRERASAEGVSVSEVLYDELKALIKA